MSETRTPARISLEEARRLFGDPGVIFLDVRKSEVFEQAHIEGAMNIRLREIPARFAEIPRGRRVITY